MGNPAVPPVQGLGRGAFAGAPDVETALRTTGLALGGRNPGDRTDSSCQLLTNEGKNVASTKVITPSSSELWLKSSPLGGCFLPFALPRGTATGTGGVEPESGG